MTAERDAYVAGFALLAAMGQAEAEDLGLDGGPLYDPAANYKRVRGQLERLGRSTRRRPARAPSTSGTPAQGATVTSTRAGSFVAATPVDTHAWKSLI